MSMTRLFALALFACFSFAVGPAYAQADNGPDYQQRLALAQKMHELRPARQQIEDAVTAAANRLPAANRDEFKTQMMKSIDVDALEKKSIEAMAQTFTKPELEKMIDYFGSPEAQSIAQKLLVYQSIVMPEITAMLDKAIMEARTGSPAPAPKQ
jgi:hypothetical protein